MTRTVTSPVVAALYERGIIAVAPGKAAEMTGLSRATIYKLIDNGALRRSKVGKATRIPVEDLVALIEDGIA